MGESLNISRQCELTGTPRSSYYYKDRPESDLNLELMRMIDEQDMKTPFYGITRMTAFLRSKGYNVKLSHPDHVWCSDITYIRMRRGFVYLTVVMDWYSRYVLSWKLSITLDAGFCIDALNEALFIGKPEIFNSDQVRSL